MFLRARHCCKLAERRSKFLSWQRVGISFQQSVQGCRNPQYHITSSLVPASSGRTLVISFPKIGDEREAAVKQVRELFPVGFSSDLQSSIIECVTDGSFCADTKEKYYLRVPSSNTGGYKHVALVGRGGESEEKGYRFTGNLLHSISKDLKSQHVDVLLDNCEGVKNLLRGVEESSYDDRRYKGTGSNQHTDVTPSPIKLETVTFVSVPDEHLSEVTDTVNMHCMMSNGVHIAKDLVGAPPNSKTPEAIATYARDIAASYSNMKCTVLNLKECVAMNMGGFLAVQQGSKFAPQFIHMTFKNKNSCHTDRKIAFVGKGLTFDSGGYNLKVGPGSLIEMMKFDMGGLGAVLGTAAAVAEIDSSSAEENLFEGVEIHFISAVCENMISRDAMRPGDIVTASNGKTIEILNTDAEGRLTLADALVYAEKEVGANVIIDLATLTGASMIALGESIGSVFASRQSVHSDLAEAAEKSGDQIWAMPLHDEYRENIKSKIADIKNIGDGKAGSITAALFLQEFVNNSVEWAHIDMAGPVWNNATHKPTGFGVRLLVEYALGQAK